MNKIEGSVRSDYFSYIVLVVISEWQITMNIGNDRNCNSP